MAQTLTFSSFQAMATHARAAMQPSAVNSVAYSGMLAASHVLRNRVRGMLGTYQKAAGPFPDWAVLAERTQKERTDQGFTADNPLYRTGELAKSYEVGGNNLNEVGVGSELDKALEMEIGVPARNVPARSVLGLGYVQSEKYMIEAFLNIFGMLLAAQSRPGLTAVSARARALEYEFKTPMIGP